MGLPTRPTAFAWHDFQNPGTAGGLAHRDKEKKDHVSTIARTHELHASLAQKHDESTTYARTLGARSVQPDAEMHQSVNHDMSFATGSLRNAPSFEVLYPIMSRLPIELDGAHLGVALPRSGNGYSDNASSHRGSQAATYTQNNLPHLDAEGLELWKVLHSLRPLSADYAGSFGSYEVTKPVLPQRHGTDPHEHAKPPTNTATDLIRRVFNWQELVLPKGLKGTFHGVVFRSKRATGSEGMSSTLYAADRRAHEEAVAHGGLLMYWYGVPGDDGMNLATCVWRDAESSRKASALPLHREAVKLAMKAYEIFELSIYRVEKHEGDSGLHIT